MCEKKVKYVLVTKPLQSPSHMCAVPSQKQSPSGGVELQAIPNEAKLMASKIASTLKNIAQVALKNWTKCLCFSGYTGYLTSLGYHFLYTTLYQTKGLKIDSVIPDHILSQQIN